MKHAILVAALALGLSTPSLAVNLVANGGFETGDFTSWTQAGDTSFDGVFGTFSGVSPFSGKYQAYFGAIGSLSGIQQTLATTAGQTYALSFALYNFGGTPNEIDIYWDGNLLATGTALPAIPYTVFSTFVTATSGTTSLAFYFQQDPSYFLLDNVVVSVPEPESWALMVAGFGMMGAAMRRRKVALTA